MEVVLSKNGWHRKLQLFVFPKAPMFNTLCPYFWLTVFCFIITVPVPIVPVIKFIYKFIYYFFKGVVWICAKTAEWFNDYICTPLFESIIRNLPEEDIMKGFGIYNWDYGTHLNNDQWDDARFWREFSGCDRITWKKKDKLSERFKAWKAKTPDWETKLKEIKARQRDAFEEKREELHRLWLEQQKEEQKLFLVNQKKKQQRELTRAKRAKRAASTQRMFITIVKYTKWLAYLVVAAVLTFVGYYLYVGISHLIHWFSTVHWAKFNHVLWIIGKIILWVIAGVVAIYLLVKLVKKCTIAPGDFKFLRKLGTALGIGFNWFGEGVILVLEYLVKFFTGVGSVFKFIGMYIKAAKENYCPAINWEEDQKEKTN